MKKKYTLNLGLLLALLIISPFVNGQTYTFTNATATQNIGPTQANVTAAYAGTTLAGSVTATAGIQNWTVPFTGTYTIEVYGAQGGGVSGGLGAKMEGEFNLVSGQILKIIVGQEGTALTTGRFDYSGGGGSFVATSTNTALIVAGGGGGAATVNAVSNGNITTTGGTGAGGTSFGAGGASGSGGGSGNITTDGGAGFTANGASGTPNPAPQAFINGGNGGVNNWGCSGCGADGGFGGGGGVNRFSTTFHGMGGGGGYSGGGSAYGPGAYAGGGASFNSGTNPVNLAGVNTGMGSVIITSLCPVTSGSLVPDLPALSDVTGSCSIPAPAAPTATNNCGAVNGTPNITFPVTTGGTTVVTWTYDDGTNLVTQTQNIIVAPIILSLDSAALPDLLGTCIVQANAINPTATNTCGTLVLGTPNVTFPVTTPGTTVITWTFTDGTSTITQLQNVIITPIDNGISQVAAALSGVAGYSYQWLNCDNGNAIVPGETNQTFTPTVAGNYSVELTLNGCKDTSACRPYTFVGIDELNNQSFVMYPNPSKDGMFTITTTTPIVQINVVDALGRTIQLHADLSTGIIDGSSLVSGKYIVSVITEDNVFTKQLMILK